MPRLATEIFERIVHLREERGITFFIIEHRLEILLDTVERVMVMDSGKIVADGKPQDVVDNPTVQEVYLGGKGGSKVG